MNYTHFSVDLRRYTLLNQMFINSKPVQYNNYCVATQYFGKYYLTVLHKCNSVHLIHRLHLLKQTIRMSLCKSKSHGQHDNHIVLIDLCVQFIIQTVYWFFTLIYMQARTHLHHHSACGSHAFPRLCRVQTAPQMHKKSFIALKFSWCDGCCLCSKLYMLYVLPSPKKNKRTH